MKTFEIKLNNQVAVFTTKSLTYNNNLFLYKNFSDVKHDTDNHIYSFMYNEKEISLQYEEKYSKHLNLIFSQIEKIEPKTVKAPIVKDIFQENENNLNPEDNILTTNTTDTDEKDAINANKKDVIDTNKETKKEKTPKAKKEKAPKTKKEKAPKTKKEKAPKTKKDKKPLSKEQLAKRKKSFITFAIILIAILLISIVYFFIFGTTTNPGPAQNSNESQQYEDIDSVIEDIQ